MRGQKRDRHRAVLAAPEVCDLLALNRPSCYDLLSRGEIPISLFRAGRKILISRESVEQLVGADAVRAFLDARYGGVSQEAVA